MLESVNSPEISFMFFLGVLFIPRLMMLWLGAVQPGSVQAIAGFCFVPRILICLMISASSGETSGGLVVLWIFAVILDIVGLVIKGAMMNGMLKAQSELFRQQKAKMLLGNDYIKRL
jgi:hypothetical protein